MNYDALEQVLHCGKIKVMNYVDMTEGHCRRLHVLLLDSLETSAIVGTTTYPYLGSSYVQSSRSVSVWMLDRLLPMRLISVS